MARRPADLKGSRRECEMDVVSGQRRLNVGGSQTVTNTNYSAAALTASGVRNLRPTARNRSIMALT